MSADKVFHSRSAGIPSEGVKDQYADGKAARLWKKFIGDSNERTQNYKDFLIGLLRQHGCKKVLDAACGTGVILPPTVITTLFKGDSREGGTLNLFDEDKIIMIELHFSIDSMMLVEEGFDVVSVDASDKMLKHALKARWEKRKDPKYDEWVIEEANWETVHSDVQKLLPGVKFDAVICLGNSFAHMLDQFGDQREQKTALSNFAKCLKPGGLLFIDHRNYDSMIDSGATPGKSIYYNCKYPVDIKTSVLVVRGKPELVTLDYVIDATSDGDINEKSEFRLCYYPHKLQKFTEMLDEAFGRQAKHNIYGDFQPLNKINNPAFYIHVVHKPSI